MTNYLARRQRLALMRQVFPKLFEVPDTKVNALSAERTFWEKATILHREYYRAEAGKLASERTFRHYHDVVVISKHNRGASAMKDIGLLGQVATHKRHFFREATAHYELAKKGTLRLSPGSELQEYLRKDYEKMREMYFGDMPDFDAVMNDIRKLEKRSMKAKWVAHLCHRYGGCPILSRSARRGGCDCSSRTTTLASAELPPFAPVTMQGNTRSLHFARDDRVWGGLNL